MANLYTYTCIDMILCLKNIYETVFSSINIAVFFPSFFSCQQYIKNYFIIYKWDFLFQLISVKFTSCRLSQANLLQHFIHLSIRKRQVQKPQPRSISFHLHGMMITFGGQMKKNWQCLWCNQSFQVINATKALAHVLRKKGMHIKRCYVAKDKSHTTRYQELRHYKQTRKGVLLYYNVI